MKFYTGQNVFDAALDRLRWLFDEFPNVIVSVSGGKDSTVIYQLAKIVAREKGRLPLRCLFLDQEAEWQSTIEQIRLIMHDPDVQPFWYQIPFRLFNATSATDQWLTVWEPAAEARWMRPKEPDSIHENTYGEDRFASMFNAVIAKDQPPRTANIGGVRTEESPSRYVGLTYRPTYKWATWGKVLNKRLEQFTFYPIYDWSYTDVWKAIHDHGWPYNKLYDRQWQYGQNLNDMRVSNVHHETAVSQLFVLQEIEPDTYERLTQRIGGIDTAGKMGKADFYIRTLPPMFSSWREYRDFLLDKLIEDDALRERFRARFATMDDNYFEGLGDIVTRCQINSIITNDWEFVKLVNFENQPRTRLVKERKHGKFYQGKLVSGYREKGATGATGPDRQGLDGAV